MITVADTKKLTSALRRVRGVLAAVRPADRTVYVAAGRITAVTPDVTVTVAVAGLEVSGPGGWVLARDVAAGAVPRAGVAPEIPALPAPECVLPVGAIAARVAPVCSTDATRYVLNGVFLEPGAAAATDGHRLAVMTLADSPRTPVIVPRAALTAFTARDGDGVLARKGEFVFLACGPVTVVARAIDGRFPDYRKVVPAVRDGAAFPGAPLARALKPFVRDGVNVGSREDGTVCAFSERILTPEEDPRPAKHRRSSPKYAPVAVVAEIGVLARVGGPAVAVNSEYLAEALAMAGPSATVTLGEDKFTPTRADAPGYSHVIMPVRTDVPARAGVELGVAHVDA